MSAIPLGRIATLAVVAALTFVPRANAIDAIVTDKTGARTKLRSVEFQKTHYTPDTTSVYINGSPGSASTHRAEVLQVGTGAIVVELQVTDIRQITLAMMHGRDESDEYLSGTVLLADGSTSIPIRIPVFQQAPEDVLNRFNWRLAGEGDLGSFSIDLMDLRGVTFTSQDQTGSPAASELTVQPTVFPAELRLRDGSSLHLNLPNQAFKLTLEGGSSYTVRSERLEALYFSTKRRTESEAGFSGMGSIEVVSKSGESYKGEAYDFGLKGQGKSGPFVFNVVVPFSGNAKELRFGK
jgi:hypothetical protein